MDLSTITQIVGRAIRKVRASDDRVPEATIAALDELGEVLHRHGYCSDPTFLLAEADEGIGGDEAIALLRGEGGDTPDPMITRFADVPADESFVL